MFYLAQASADAQQTVVVPEGDTRTELDEPFAERLCVLDSGWKTAIPRSRKSQLVPAPIAAIAVRNSRNGLD
jgi:hypothetical protein